MTDQKYGLDYFHLDHSASKTQCSNERKKVLKHEIRKALDSRGGFGTDIPAGLLNFEKEPIISDITKVLKEHFSHHSQMIQDLQSYLLQFRQEALVEMNSWEKEKKKQFNQQIAEFKKKLSKFSNVSYLAKQAL